MSHSDCIPSTRKRVLVVDDEKSIRDSLKLILQQHFDVSTAENGQAALSEIKEYVPDIVLLDVSMPLKDGLHTLKEIRETCQGVPVIMLTGDQTVPTAVEAMKLGALDYLNKPFDVTRLTSLIVDVLGEGEVVTIVADDGPAIEPEDPAADFGPMVGKSPLMRNVFKKVDLVAKRETTVLITGESGTGKELIARQIHERSQRADKAFIPINCAAIPETLIESELFGHEKGSFTSAVEQRVGYFELADGGTIFLDEIGELNPSVQVKMLRFLQEQEFYRVGRSKPIKVNVRVVAATNKNLEDLIKTGAFRQDLYYRINVVNIELPPLRDRMGDLSELLTHFIDKYCPVYGGRRLEISDEAMEVLSNYDWPGNVRELENVVESLMALAPNDLIKACDLPPRITSADNGESFSLEVFHGSLNFQDAERTFETEFILRALKKTNFVQTRAADLLGISRRILKYKMDKLGITDMIAEEGVVEEEGL